MPEPKGDSLKTYRARRRFARTPEPVGDRKAVGPKPIFVIQKHDATSLHYDFRLQIGDVLKSWAVPKGPSTDPSVKRLAMPTEDHPLEYADFEGVIPEGEYGGGTVIVWDKGTFRNLKEDGGRPVPLDKAFEQGHLIVWLEGKKLRGGYALIRTGGFGRSRQAWLLIKKRDREADASRYPVHSQPESALTGRTIEEVAGQARPPDAG
jgi:DNA ligase D-like protein (predicted 3'-phosphoesterase)